MELKWLLNLYAHLFNNIQLHYFPVLSFVERFQHNLIIKLSINFHHSKYLCLQASGCVQITLSILYLKQRQLFFLLKYTFFSVLET